MKLYKTKTDDEIYYYHLKNGEKRWMYRHKYYDSLGKRREKKKSGFKTEKATLKALLKVKADLLEGSIMQVEKSDMTVSQWLDVWYEAYHVNWKDSTQLLHKDIMNRIIKPLLGKYKQIELDKSTYQRVFINKLQKKYAPSCVKSYDRIFKMSVNAAVDDDILPRNRFNKITIKDRKEKDNYLTVSELGKLLKTGEEHLNETSYTLIFTLAYTGLRKGEALGLQWENINFRRKTLTVERTRDNGGVRAPKTKTSYRTIPVDDKVLVQLKKYKVWCKERKLKYGKHLNDDDFVFISYRNGNPINAIAVNDSLKKLIEKAGVSYITVHGLRHTHATILLNKGLPPAVIAERLGNTAQMIDSVYGHVLKEMEDRAVKLFSESLGARSGAN